jgi:hypothetical protein
MPFRAWLFLFEFAMGFLDENKIPLSKLSRDAGVNISTVWRWAQRGVKGVVLETFAIGGRRWTTDEAYHRFVVGVTDATASKPPQQAAKDGREAAVNKAERELREEGL